MYRRFFDLDQGSAACGFGSQPVSFERINSIAILPAARIPVQMEFLVATGPGYCRSRSVKQLQSLSFQPRSIAARSLVCMAKALDSAKLTS